MGLKLQTDLYINFPPEIFERIYKYYRFIYANSKNIPDHWASRYDEKMESFDFSSGKSILFWKFARPLADHNLSFEY